MTAEQLAALAAQGSYWWMRPDGSFYATNEYSDANPDVYLLSPTPAQLGRWESDWELAVEDLAPMFDLLDQFRN